METGVKFNVIYIGARALLNDNNGQLFTNATLEPYLIIAWKELMEILEDSGIPYTLKTSANITVKAGITDIGGPTGPALPLDIVEINELWERSAGTNQDFILMRRDAYLPPTPIQSSYLIYWSWQGQVIRFIGATADVEVKLQYVADISQISVNDDTIIPLINARNPLQFRVAALAAEFIGENPTRAASLNGQAGASMDRLLNLSISHQQSIVTRRRPFRGGWKTKSQIW